MLTGRAPGGPPPPVLDVPPRLAEVVLRALAPSPAERFATMDDLHAALAAVLGGPPAAQDR
jgi:hypothetical protein